VSNNSLRIHCAVNPLAKTSLYETCIGPARALEDAVRGSPGLLTALLHIPCKASRVPYNGLSNMV